MNHREETTHVVLAILAAVAIPSFTSLNAEARVSGAKTTLANLAKECAVKLVDANPSNNTYNATTYAPNAFALTITSTGGSAGTCKLNDIYTLTATANDLPTFNYNAQNGAKTCTAGTLTGGTNVALGCDLAGGSPGSW